MGKQYLQPIPSLNSFKFLHTLSYEHSLKQKGQVAKILVFSLFSLSMHSITLLSIS